MFREDKQQAQQMSGLIQQLWEMTRQMAALKLEDFKLMLSQKLAKLLGTVTFGAIVLISAVSFVMFVGFSITELISDSVPLWAAYLLVAGIILVMVLLVFVLRRRLIFDSLARYVSRLLFE